MSGYCPDCGNVICLCKELLHEQLNNSKLFHCTNFEGWIFSVNFGDADLYLKHSPYMKVAYDARNEEIEALQEELETTKKQLDEAIFHLIKVCLDDTTSDQFCGAEEFLSNLKHSQLSEDK